MAGTTVISIGHYEPPESPAELRGPWRVGVAVGLLEFDQPRRKDRE